MIIWIQYFSDPPPLIFSFCRGFLLGFLPPAKVFANIPPVWPHDDRWGVDSYIMYFVLYVDLIVKYNANIIIISWFALHILLLLLLSYKIYPEAILLDKPLSYPITCLPYRKTNSKTLSFLLICRNYILIKLIILKHASHHANIQSPQITG